MRSFGRIGFAPLLLVACGKSEPSAATDGASAMEALAQQAGITLDAATSAFTLTASDACERLVRANLAVSCVEKATPQAGATESEFTLASAPKSNGVVLQLPNDKTYGVMIGGLGVDSHGKPRPTFHSDPSRIVVAVTPATPLSAAEQAHFSAVVSDFVNPVQSVSPLDDAPPPKASGAKSLRCGDGTISDTCTCAGSHRGCCSRHGGVAGCAP